MAYICDLGSGSQVYLDNQGTQTMITISYHLPGQQQQSSSSLSTGIWTADPEAYQTPTGIVLKITTAQRTQFFGLQGNRVGAIAQSPALETAQPMQVQQIETMPSSPMPSMQPMQPMQPMTMGNMQMSMDPMEMHMGNMEMRMGSAAPATPATGKRFCTQCGTQTDPSDRFCASCGHALK